MQKCPPKREQKPAFGVSWEPSSKDPLLQISEELRLPLNPPLAFFFLIGILLWNIHLQAEKGVWGQAVAYDK